MYYLNTVQLYGIKIFKCQTDDSLVYISLSVVRVTMDVWLSSRPGSDGFETVHSPLSFSWDRRDIARLILPLMAAILIFKCTKGAGVGITLLSSFDTHARWQPVTQSARFRRSYGKTRTVNSLDGSTCGKWLVLAKSSAKRKELIKIW